MGVSSALLVNGAEIPMTKPRNVWLSFVPAQRRNPVSEGCLGISRIARIIFAFCAVAAITVSAQTFTSLASFGDSAGYYPDASLIQGTDGNFYGTTPRGSSTGCRDGFCGTIFKVTPEGTLSTFYNFCAKGGEKCPDGSNPLAGLTLSTDGDFYGTTYYGGTYAEGVGAGTVFKINAGGKHKTLYSFCSQGGNSCTDGDFPAAGVIQATNGNFYGVTSNAGPYGGGTVFKITAQGRLTTLRGFCIGSNDCPDGATPYVGLVQAAER